MLPQLLTYGKSFAAVEHTVGADAKEIISFLQLKKKQKELVIESKGQVASFEKLLPAIQAQKHLFLVINNQQVLLKKVDAIDENQEHLVKIAFPSIKLSDFYYEVLSCKEHSFVTICRKAYVDDLIAHYESEGISVVAISFHNFAIQQLATFIEQEEIHTSNSLISLQKNSIVNIQNQATEKIVYNINDLQITNDELLPLAGIIDYYSGTQKEQLGFGKLQKQLQQKQHHNRFFDLGLKVALGSIFLILLINFMVFSGYRSEMIQLNNELLVNSNYRNSLVQLQNNVTKKAALVKNITSLSASKTSWYLNELGTSVPSNILLVELKYQPLRASIKKSKEILIDTHTMHVKGISKSSTDFSKWIAFLKEQKWVKNITIRSYGKGKKTTTSFEYLIHIADEGL